ncbi:MAG: prepilin-type N-terminal cleavage/methylation domain-containing protein [Phycisphaerales bacterium]
MPRTPTDIIRHTDAPSVRARARGFTLAELLVAVAVVIVLSLAIGQVFSAVGRLVGTGAAISEVDQLARAIERQMRDDFEAFGRMRSDETFFAIRSRAIGDINNNAVVDPSLGEIAVYLSQADKDDDLRSGRTSPYQRDARGVQTGKGVTVRLDEMVFLSRASEKARFVSAQQNGAEGEPVSASVARISYGHGLLPSPPVRPDGGEFDPTLPIDIDNRPVRRLFPDTRRVALPGSPDLDAVDVPTQRNLAWGSVFGEPFTRNEFASDFPLLRQPLLLYGGRAAGNIATQNTLPEAPVNANFRRRTYAPYIRDFETIQRNGISAVPQRTSFRLLNGWTYPAGTLSSPRQLRWGRTDICAMDRDDVQRWLEGIETDDQHGAGDDNFDPPQASAFSTGLFEESTFDDDDPAEAPLVWKRPFGSVPGGPGFEFPDAALMYRLPPAWGLRGAPPIAPDYLPSQAVRVAGTRLRSAIAGVFTRMLVEPAQQQVPTRLNPMSGLSANAAVNNLIDPIPADAAMDQHALLAPRCSNFEIAWSDGTTWNSDTPLRVFLGSGSLRRQIAEYNRGDVVWFDSVFTRRQFLNISVAGVTPVLDLNPLSAAPDPEVLGEITDLSVFPVTTPSSTAPDSPSADRTAANEVDRRINVFDESFPSIAATDGAYDPYRSGGDKREYLAIWGFRRPIVRNQNLGPQPADQRMTLEWSDSAWEKPRLIRVRMTLHDSLNRIAGGKSYEYIFSIEPAAN